MTTACTGRLRASRIKIKGPGTDVGSLTITWSIRAAGATARIRGVIGDRVVDLRAPAPSYY